MIVFEFDTVTSVHRDRVLYWLGTTCIGVDEKHTEEIYEQLDAEHVFNL